MPAAASASASRRLASPARPGGLPVAERLEAARRRRRRWPARGRASARRAPSRPPRRPRPRPRRGSLELLGGEPVVVGEAARVAVDRVALAPTPRASPRARSSCRRGRRGRASAWSWHSISVGPSPVAGAVGGLAGGLEDRLDVVAVDAHAREAVVRGALAPGRPRTRARSASSRRTGCSRARRRRAAAARRRSSSPRATGRWRSSPRRRRSSRRAARRAA